MYGPEITGDIVRLAPMDESMAESFFAWINAPGVNRYRPAPPVASVDAEREWIRRIGESTTDVVWAIYCLEDGVLIGATGLHSLSEMHKRAVSGTIIGKPEYWGRGIGGELVMLRTRYAFEELNLNKLISEVIPENNASLRMLMRSGYRIVGLQRKHFLTGDMWMDAYILECFREDWEKAKQQNGW